MKSFEHFARNGTLLLQYNGNFLCGLSLEEVLQFQKELPDLIILMRNQIDEEKESKINKALAVLKDAGLTKEEICKRV